MTDAARSDPEDLDALVRRVDPDRWLSSRFVGDPARRADGIAAYAYDHELARAPRVASNPLLGANRRFIEQHVPHMGSLIEDDIAAVIDKADVLVVGLNGSTVATACSRLCTPGFSGRYQRPMPLSAPTTE